eukprot:g3570.t1
MRLLVVDRRNEIAAEQSAKSWGFVRVQGRDFREVGLMQESRRFWRTFDTIDWQQTGHLAVFEAEDVAKGRRVRAWAERAERDHGVRYEMIESREKLAALLPGFDPTSLRGGGGNKTRMDYHACYTPDDGSVDPHKATVALARRTASLAQQNGVDLDVALGCEILSISQQEDGDVLLRYLERERQGTLTTDKVVIATAGWAPEFLRRNGLQDYPSLRLHATAGKVEAPAGFCSSSAPASGSATSSPPASRDETSTPVPTFWCHGLSFRSHPCGKLLTFADGGAREEHDLGLETLLYGPRFVPHLRQFIGQTKLKLRRASFPSPAKHECPEPNGARLERAEGLLRELFPHPLRPAGASRRKISHSWAGWIDITPDMVPVIDYVSAGRGSDRKNVIVSAGYSGHGLGLAPAAGRLTADLVLEEAQSDTILKGFRLNRFQEQYFHKIEGLV